MSADAMLWHELECGSYRVDLPMWCELTGRAGSPVLELGSGAGRVALDLAGRAHPVVALDNDPALVEALRRHARGLPVEAVLGDMRDFELDARFPLIIVPMQSIQLLAGPNERRALLRCVAAHLAPGGLFAAAVVDVREAVGGQPQSGPWTPDVLRREGWVYRSQPSRVALADGGLVIERARVATSPEGASTTETERVRLVELDAATLEREAAAAGLAPAGRRRLPTTPEHVGTTVVVLRHAHA